MKRSIILLIALCATPLLRASDSFLKSKSQSERLALSFIYSINGFSFEALKKTIFIESSPRVVRFKSDLNQSEYKLEKIDSKKWKLSDAAGLNLTLDDSDLQSLDKLIEAEEVSQARLDPTQHLKTKNLIPMPAGYENSSSVYQCTSNIEVSIGILKHTWLEIPGHGSFGMPYTDEHTYFGGRAHIFSPDPFLFLDSSGKKCSPLYRSSKSTENDFLRNISCIANELSLPVNIYSKSLSTKTSVIHLDYSALDHNCLTAIKFLVECANGFVSQNPNLGVGGELKWDRNFSVKKLPEEFEQIHKLFLDFKSKLTDHYSWKPESKSLASSFQKITFNSLSPQELKHFEELKKISQKSAAIKTFTYFSKWIHSILVDKDLVLDETKSLKDICTQLKQSCAMQKN